MTNISALIKTIGRPTLQNAVDSAEREGIRPIVVSDGFPLYDEETDEMIVGGAYSAIELKRNWGCYGAVAANAGVALCDTDWLMILDDDDELAEGAGDFIREKIANNPNISIWIPGLKFNNGMVLCDGSVRVVQPGNVAVPIAKVECFTEAPFRTKVPEKYKDYADFFQIKEMHGLGYQVGWLGKCTYLVRPNLDGTNGRGK
tara:strand:+ start:9738 stop:10343 length:606 start_codon:yes stop_codon:yes gene_type:complete